MDEDLIELDKGIVMPSKVIATWTKVVMGQRL